jgi:hypothetical protein
MAIAATIQKRLIASVLSSHFGETVETAGVALHVRGELSLAGLAHFSGLGGKAVREALLVLLHHSLVTYSVSEGSTLYRLDEDAVLHRIGYPTVLASVSRTFSPGHAELLFEVMAQGKLPVNTLSAAQTSVLNALMEAGLVETVTSATVRSKTTDADGEEDEDNDKDSEERSGLKRRSHPSSPLAKKPQILAKASGFVRFRARDGLFERIVGAQLEQVVARRVGAFAGRVFGAIWRLAAAEGALKTKTGSWTFSGTQLRETLPPSSDTKGQPAIGPCLARLAFEFSDFLRASPMTASAFVLDIPEALTHLRLLHIESYIRTTFGTPSARLYRLLRGQRLAEDRQLARLAMMPGREARERLFQLLRVGLVQLQEVPRTADHAPARTIYLWAVKLRTNGHSLAASTGIPSSFAYFDTFASRIATTLLNVRTLAAHERLKHSALLEKVERTDVAGNLALLGDSEKEQLGSLRRVLRVLGVKALQLRADLFVMTAK